MPGLEGPAHLTKIRPVYHAGRLPNGIRLPQPRRDVAGLNGIREGTAGSRLPDRIQRGESFGIGRVNNATLPGFGRPPFQCWPLFTSKPPAAIQIPSMCGGICTGANPATSTTPCMGRNAAKMQAAHGAGRDHAPQTRTTTGVDDRVRVTFLVVTGSPYVHAVGWRRPPTARQKGRPRTRPTMPDPATGPRKAGKRHAGSASRRRPGRGRDCLPAAVQSYPATTKPHMP